MNPNNAQSAEKMLIGRVTPKRWIKNEITELHNTSFEE